MAGQHRHRSISNAIVAKFERLEKQFGMSDVIGLIVGVIVGRGLLGGVTSSPIFLVTFFTVVVGVGVLIALLRGSSPLFQMAAYTFYTVAWLLGLLAITFLGIGLDVLLLSLNWGGAVVFLVFLGFYLYVSSFKYYVRGMIGKKFDIDSDLATLKKKIAWATVERNLSRAAIVITVVSAVLSAYFAYQAVQITLNRVTTVQLGSGKLTVGNQSLVYPRIFQTAPYVISGYRYAIVHPYYTADTRLAYPNRYIFGPVYTDVIADGKTSRLTFPPMVWGTGSYPLVTGLPNNLTTVSGLSMYTISNCAGNCTIPDVTIYIQADLVR